VKKKNTEQGNVVHSWSSTDYQSYWNIEIFISSNFLKFNQAYYLRWTSAYYLDQYSWIYIDLHLFIL